MVTINTCELTPNGRQLHINASVYEYYADGSDTDSYANVYIDSIYIDTNDNYLSTGPTGKDTVAIHKSGLNKKSTGDIFFDVDSFQKKIFYVYFITTGTPDSSSPCDARQTSVMGIAYNKGILYTNGGCLLNEANGCKPKDKLIDYIIKVKAFEIALKTQHYTKANYLWDNIVNAKLDSTVTSSCGCNG